MRENLATVIQQITVPILHHGRKIQWFENYRFAASDAPDFLVRLRRQIWELGLEESNSTSVVINWLPGIKLKVHLGNDISLCVFVAGCYEPNEMAFMQSFLVPGMTFIDVGANEGLFSLFAKRCVGPEGRVVAFEPSPREFHRLYDNLTLNPSLTLELHQIGLCDSEGTGFMRIAEDKHSGHNTLGEFAYDVKESSTDRITLQTLDSIYKEESWCDVDMIKIDTEGAELAVLRGGLQVIEKFRPVILLELVPDLLRNQSASPDLVWQYLVDKGYTLHLFGQTGRPEALRELPAGGANVLAIPQEKLLAIDI